MAPSKTRQVDHATAAFDDDLSVINPLTFVKAKKGARKIDGDRDKAAKRVKLLALKKHKGVEVNLAHSMKEPLRSADTAKMAEAGKSHFYYKSARVTQEMLNGQLLGFGHLDLSVDSVDYGEPHFYKGSSSSGDMDPRKERSYRLAHALGVLSDTSLACGFDLKEIGLLPRNGEPVSKFSDFCNRSHSLSEVERDLLKVDGATLAEAAGYHAISVSCLTFNFTFCMHFTLYYTSSVGAQPGQPGSSCPSVARVGCGDEGLEDSLWVGHCGSAIVKSFLRHT